MMSEETPTPADESVDTVAADTEPVKRGPGRPKKQQPEPDFSQVAGLLSEVLENQKAMTEVIQEQQKQIAYLQNPNLPPPAEDLEPEPLPEGTVRFFSKIKEYQIGIEDEISIIADGRIVRQKTSPGSVTPGSTTARMLHFQDHVKDFHLPEDEAMVEYLMNHPDYGVDFVIDSSAIKRTTKAKVVEGPRGMKPDHQPKPSLEATF